MGNCLTRKSQIDLSGIYNQDNAQRGWTNAGVYATTAYLRITSDKEFYYLEVSDGGKKFNPSAVWISATSPPKSSAASPA
ncbi:MAG: hypothetical protein IKQ70_10255 [Bacteroidales bacterium]|nr:hypothetical protein [Bacteroidales bacterium]